MGRPDLTGLPLIKAFNQPSLFVDINGQSNPVPLDVKGTFLAGKFRQYGCYERMACYKDTGEDRNEREFIIRTGDFELTPAMEKEIDRNLKTEAEIKFSTVLQFR